MKLCGGESGIRTHGTFPYDGFQDRSVITTSVSLREVTDYGILSRNFRFVKSLLVNYGDNLQLLYYIKYTFILVKPVYLC